MEKNTKLRKVRLNVFITVCYCFKVETGTPDRTGVHYNGLLTVSTTSYCVF